jgi:PAS domain S-box-containing protein
VSAPSVRARGRILIVDDNAELTETLRAVIASGIHGMRIETAQTGAEGLERAKAGFDVAIVDVMLPDASGVDLIPRLREGSPHAEVLLVTGFASVDAAIAALRSGAFAFVLKSFRPEELIAIVEQALTKVELKREREDLEQRYRDLVEVTDVLVIALDSDDRVALMNPKAASFAGVSPDEARGQALVDAWIPKADRAAMRAALADSRSLPPGKAREVETGFEARVEGPMETRAGDLKARIRWHLGSGADPGALVYGIGIDVTERRALERRAADAEAFSAMGELAMNLAHEIRNPLNAAVLQLHLLNRHLDKLEAEEATRASLKQRVRIVGDEVGRLSRLLGEFLELARPRGIAREPVSVPRLVDQVLALEEQTALARGVKIERHLPEDGCIAIGDHEKLKQVAINLVLNALEAMKSGGELRAAVSPHGERVRIVVEDTGPGIEPEVLRNVFDPFFTTKEAGTGLGLAIVRKIIDQHGGEVKIETERDRGTRVIVEIPTGR